MTNSPDALTGPTTKKWGFFVPELFNDKFISIGRSINRINHNVKFY